MGMHYYTAKFRGVAFRKERKESSNSTLKFHSPKWKEIVLFDIETTAPFDMGEEQAGLYFLPLLVKKRKKPAVVLQTDDHTRIEVSKLNSLICFPDVGGESKSNRHQYETDFWRSNSDFIIWEGEAKFTYFVPDPSKPTESNAKIVVEEQSSSSSTELNDKDWLEVNQSTDDQPYTTRIFDRTKGLFSSSRGVANKANRRLPNLLLILAILLFFANPFLGLFVLGVALYSLSRRKKGLNAVNSNKGPKGSARQSSPFASFNNSSNGNSFFNRGRFSWIRIIWIILALLMLSKLWSLGSILFWPLMIATLLYVIAGGRASGGWSIIARIIFGFVFLCSLLLLLGTFVSTSDFLPEDRGEGDARTEKVKREGSEEISSRHTIVWQNPLAAGKNKATYYTADEPYRSSLSAHESVRQISQNTSAKSYWGQVYSKLLVEDNQKIDSLANVVVKVAKDRNYNSLETAEYLVSLIQEIPYVLVHDNSCQEVVNQSGGFVRNYHIQRKPCLSNVVAGVQSPYEFMHTLEGDCDTRSLLGHAILRKLNISSSVWISEQYGHSILGVGVPAQSRAKKVVNGVPHYGVELTAKGFRVGMISPDQNQMRNWEIALFKNF
jgi:uncharacterized membrane protein